MISQFDRSSGINFVTLRLIVKNLTNFGFFAKYFVNPGCFKPCSHYLNIFLKLSKLLTLETLDITLA